MRFFYTSTNTHSSILLRASRHLPRVLAAVYSWGSRRRHAALRRYQSSALRLRDPGLESLKTDALLDPLRREPRFKAIKRS